MATGRGRRKKHGPIMHAGEGERRDRTEGQSRSLTGRSLRPIMVTELHVCDEEVWGFIRLAAGAGSDRPFAGRHTVPYRQ